MTTKGAANMNKYEYEVTITNPIPQPVDIASLVFKIEAPNTTLAERMLGNKLQALFKMDPQLEWSYNLVDYQMRTDA
jgi:hypothetical protein